MMFVLFGVVLYFGIRSVLERSPQQQQQQATQPQQPTSPWPTVPTVTGPPGWPNTAPPYMECETVMATIPKEQVSKMLSTVMNGGPAWAMMRETLINGGQSKLVACLEGAKTFSSTMKM